MQKINVVKCYIDGIFIIEPSIIYDDRGYFFESYNEQELNNYGLNCNFVQENQFFSKKNVLRGLHYQKKYQCKKLIRVINGKIFDVVVDVRKNSPTYGKVFTIELSSDNKKQLLITEGFAHGYYVMEDNTEVLFKLSDFWHKDNEVGIPWNDKKLNIQWPIINKNEIIIADKDKNYKQFDFMED